jgi:hypothetical protein
MPPSMIATTTSTTRAAAALLLKMAALMHAIPPGSSSITGGAAIGVGVVDASIVSARPPHRRRRDGGRLLLAVGGEQQTETGETTSGAGGAFNPNLVAYDPNSLEYAQGGSSSSSSSSTSVVVIPEGWSPCPKDDPNYDGNRASYDCESYVHCIGSQISGEYVSCMGLLYDNDKNVCVWAEEGNCATTSPNALDDDDDGGGGEGDDGANTGLEVVNEIIGSATDVDVNRAYTAGSNGATANNDVTGWSGGTDWGGSWIDGIW